MAKRYGEGSISEYQTQSGKRYSVVYGYTDRSGKYRQKRMSGFKTKAEAQKAAREALHMRDRGRHLDPSDMTVERYAREEYLPSLVRRERAPITIRNYTSALDRWVLPSLGSLPIQQVTRHDVTAMLDELTHLSPATRKLCLVLLTALLDRAIYGDIDRLPDLIEGLRENRTDTDARDFRKEMDTIVSRLTDALRKATEAMGEIQEVISDMDWQLTEYEVPEPDLSDYDEAIRLARRAVEAR